MPDRRTQSYAAVVPLHRNLLDRLFARARIHAAKDPTFIDRVRSDAVTDADRAACSDPEDFEPELPPSPTFWPRDEPKEPQS